MPEQKADDGHRDFPGRGLLINILRALHIVGLAGISVAVLAGMSGAANWGALSHAPGCLRHRKLG